MIAQLFWNIEFQFQRRIRSATNTSSFTTALMTIDRLAATANICYMPGVLTCEQVTVFDSINNLTMPIVLEVLEDNTARVIDNLTLKTYQYQQIFATKLVNFISF